MIPLILALGCGSPEVPSCEESCPEGTRIARTTELEVAAQGGFVWSSGSCEALCEPFQPCLAPNVPTVYQEQGQDVFRCAPLDGFSDLPPTSEIDLAEGTWTPSDLPDPLVRASGLGAPVTWATAGDVDDDGVVEVVAGHAYDRVTLIAGAPVQDDAGAEILDATALPWAGPDPLLVTYLDAGGRVSLRLDTYGDGWQAGPPLLATEAYPNVGDLPDVADLDGDGHLDLVVLVGSGPSQGVNVLWGEPAGFGPATFVDRPCGDCLERVGVGDLDGDGLVDLVGRQPMLHRAGRTFVTAGTLDDLGPLDPFAVGDLDADGRADLIASQGATLHTWWAAPDGALEPWELLSGPCAGQEPHSWQMVPHGAGEVYVQTASRCDETLVALPLDGVVEIRSLGLADAALVVVDGTLLAVTP